MRRIALCMGSECKQDGPADEFYERLCQILGRPNPLGVPAHGIKWTVSACLNFCGEGPNMVIFDEHGEGTWYKHLDRATLETLIEQEILPYLHTPQP